MKFNSHMLCFTAAYWFVDLLVILLIRTDRSPTTVQLIYHHVIGIYLMFSACYVGISFPKVSQITLTCEISNFFITQRDIMGKHNWKGPVANLNMLLFFVTYTLSRVFLFPVIIVLAWTHMQRFEGLLKMDYLRLALTAANFILFFLIYLLNLFWYKIILKGVMNVASGKSVNEGQSKEDYDGFEADKDAKDKKQE
jgi:hypothetical protein